MEIFYKPLQIFSALFFSVVMYGQTNHPTPPVAQKGNAKELSSKEVDLGYKKINQEVYTDLVRKNEQAKIAYEKLTTHPKLLTKQLGEDQQFVNSLKQYELISLSYNAKDIRFNSLFVKTIIEDPKIHYVSFSSTEAFLYADPDINTTALINSLNDISLSPITSK